jgi:hypothetical protein
MRSTRVQVLSVVLLGAVLLLSVATLTHVHGVSDPDAYHTVADFLLQFQILNAILLVWIAAVVAVSLAVRRAIRTISRCPPPQPGTVRALPRAPPTAPA